MSKENRSEKNRKTDTAWGKVKKYMMPTVAGMILSSGTFLGFDISNIFQPQFSPEEKSAILRSTKIINELDGDLKRVAIDYKNKKYPFSLDDEHIDNEDIHMSKAVKDPRYVAAERYEKDIDIINKKLSLLIEYHESVK